VLRETTSRGLSGLVCPSRTCVCAVHIFFIFRAGCVCAVCVLDVCVFITAVPITKLFAWGEGDSGGHVL
jgi:hypothetical protein